MSADETVSFSLEVNVEPAAESMRKLQTIFYRTLGLLRRISGNDNLNQAIDMMQRAIAVANQLRLTMIALHAASGPVGWALAGIGLATSVVSMAELMGGGEPLELEMRGFEY